MKKNKLNKKAEFVRENSVGWILKRLCAQLDVEMKRALADVSVNLNEFAMLMTLMEYDGLTQSELGKKITLPGYATTRTLDSLETSRLVERHTDERSRRSHRIYLTAKGRELGPILFTIIDQVNRDFLAPVSAAERSQLKNVLHKLFAARLS